MSYERVYIATPREEYFMKMLDSLLYYNHRQGTPLYSKKLQEAVSRFMEEGEKYAERNIKKVNVDDFFQSPVTINTQKKDANLTNERRIASDIYAETIKEFKGCVIRSTISNSAHSNSEEKVDAISYSKEQVDAISDSGELVGAVRDQKSDTKVATYTTNGNFRKNC